MNTETKASLDALSATQGNSSRQRASRRSGSGDQLLGDLKMVIADVEQLIRDATGAPADGFAALRKQYEQKLSDAKTRVDLAKNAMRENTRQAADAAYAYVRQNPWRSAGVSVLVGVIFGLILAGSLSRPASIEPFEDGDHEGQ